MHCISPINYVVSVFTPHLQLSCPFEKLTLNVSFQELLMTCISAEKLCDVCVYTLSAAVLSIRKTDVQRQFLGVVHAPA